MKPIANTQTDDQNAKLAFRLIDIATYRGAFTAKKCIYNSNMIRYNNKYNKARTSYKTRCPVKTVDSRRLEILGGDSNIEQLQEDLWEQQNNNEQQQ